MPVTTTPHHPVERGAMHIPGTLPCPPPHPSWRARRARKLLAGCQGLLALGLLAMAFGVLGCDSGLGGSGQGGGSNNSDAFLQITRVTPVYLDQTTSNVDAFRDKCTTGNSTATTDEPFTDHNAT